MKFKKILNCSLAMAIVFGAATVATGCGKDDTASLQEDQKYQIYKKALAAGATDLSYEDWLAAIRGAKGEDGHTPVITIGQNGNWYIDGADTGTRAEGRDGQPGASVKWTATASVPSDNVGDNGDMHFNTDTQSIYRKEDGRWVEKAVISDGQDGEDGREIELRVNGAYIQWGYKENNIVSDWNNLIPLSNLKGDQGSNVQIQKTATHIQYSYDGTNWVDLISLDILKGPQGDTPVVTIENGNWHVDGVDTGISALGAKGETGEAGREIQLNVTSTHIQWRYEGETEYRDLVALSTLTGKTGENGREIEFNVTSTHIEWKYSGETEYQELVSLDSLKGEKGDTGTSVVDVLTSADKWGIEVTHTFVMSDGSEKTTTYRVIDIVRNYAVESEEDIATLMEYGVTKIALANDIELTKLIVVSGKLTVNLNGYELSFPTDTVGDGIFYVPAGGDLTIEGDGVVNSASLENDYAMAVWADGGNVTINGGTFTNVGSKTIDPLGNVNNNDLIYVKNGGRVTVNGGEFIGENSRWLLNSHNTRQGVIVVNGGKFHEFNPQYAYTDDAGNTNTVNYLGAGVKVKSNGYYYEVVKDEEYASRTVAVRNESELLRVIENSQYNHVSIYLTRDIEVTTAVVIGENRSISINLNGKKISAPNDVYGDGIFRVLAGGHLEIEGQGIVDAGTLANHYCMAIWADGGHVVINGGLYTNVGAPTIDPFGNVNNNDLIYVKNYGHVEINGGTFIGNNSRWVLNSHNTLLGTFDVKGGVFVEFNPSYAKTDDEGRNPHDYVNELYCVSSMTAGGVTAYVVSEFTTAAAATGDIRYNVDGMSYTFLLDANSNKGWKVLAKQNMAFKITYSVESENVIVISDSRSNVSYVVEGDTLRVQDDIVVENQEKVESSL